ncbi:MAG: hypothetical protein NC120_01750 [Ruminococcus sp.]|nr:hypothetical protein [Ruminococcus sp.]
MTNYLNIPSLSAPSGGYDRTYPQTASKDRAPDTGSAALVYGELPQKNGETPQTGKLSEEADKKRRFDSFECQTCKNRKYQDGSDDMGVSFQNATKVNPKAAAAAVRGHEQEHVTRNRAKAKREGKEIVSQSVTIHTGICPECGKIYVSGGTTRTATKNSSDGNKAENRFNAGMNDPEAETGGLLNTAA